MAVNPDFKDMFSALSDAQVDYLVIGAHAVMYYADPRYTKDIDIWVRPTASNAKRVLVALAAFGAPSSDLCIADLCVSGTIFQIGIEPNRIDVTTGIDGVEFEQAWENRAFSTYGDLKINIIGQQELILNKRATGRPQDFIDLAKLEDLRSEDRPEVN